MFTLHLSPKRQFVCFGLRVLTSNSYLSNRKYNNKLIKRIIINSCMMSCWRSRIFKGTWTIWISVERELRIEMSYSTTTPTVSLADLIALLIIFLSSGSRAMSPLKYSLSGAQFSLSASLMSFSRLRINFLHFLRFSWTNSTLLLPKVEFSCW